MFAISSPGSTTMASRDCSSPKMEQLHCSIPTGKISCITFRFYTRRKRDHIISLTSRNLQVSAPSLLASNRQKGGRHHVREIQDISNGRVIGSRRAAGDIRPARRGTCPTRRRTRFFKRSKVSGAFVFERRRAPRQGF